MTALTFTPAQGAGPCHETGCNRSGTRRVLIAGYPVLSERHFDFRSLLLCTRCAKAMERVWEGALE